MPEAHLRPAWADVDLGAVAGNVRSLRRVAAPAAVCAVVKADGYGHGAVPVARAALAAGATGLAVALVEEGVELRDAGIDAPILLLSEPAVDAMADAVGAGLIPTVYTDDGLEAAVAAHRPGAPPLALHVKVNSGMNRVGADPGEALKLAERVAATPEVALAGLWTHLAVADEPDSGFTAEQRARFERVRSELAARGVAPATVHAANSAGALLHPDCRYDMVRCGIAVYGYAPAPGLTGGAELRPALTLRARVSHLRRVPAGEAISYGQRYRLTRESVIATVPLGYADGVTRALSAAGGAVLVGGERRPIAGTVTMDQLMVDCGADSAVARGDEVVLLGTQGAESVTADEWARRLGTISYEVLCGVGPRVPRRYHEGPAAAGAAP